MNAVNEQQRTALERFFPNIISDWTRRQRWESDDDYRQHRKAVAAAMKRLVGRAEKEDRGLNDEEKQAFDGLEVMVRTIDDKFDVEDDGIQPINPGTQPLEFLNPTAPGDEVRILTRSQRVQDLPEYRAAPSLRDLTFGGYIRAMVCGARNEAERRALAEGTDSAGGFTVPSALSAQVIDRLRARSVAIQAGAQTVPLPTMKTTIARLATDPATTWHVENAQETGSDPTFEGVTFTAKTLISLVRVSRELLEDSVNLDSALQNAFARAMAVELDRVAIKGSGTGPEPKGVVNDLNILSVDAAAAPLHLTLLIDGLEALATANAGPATAAIMHPADYFFLSKMTDAEGQPLAPFPMLDNIPRLHSTNGVDGTILLGDWTNLMIGIRSSLRIELLRERYADFHQYAFLAHLRADVAIAHPESFVEVRNYTR